MSKKIQGSTQDSEKNLAYELRQWLLENDHFITLADSGDLYMYDHEAGIYRPGVEPKVRNKLDRHLGRSTNPNLITRVVISLKDHTYIERSKVLESSSGLLVVRNGVLDLNTLELQPHTPRRYCLSQIPVVYDVQADCPEFNKWVETTLEPKYHRVLQQWFGFMIMPGYSYKKALILLGPRHTGKTVLTHIMIAFIGEDNARMKNIQSICHRFGAFDLFGAMANICDEQPGGILHNLEEFKKLTGGGHLEGEMKGAQHKVKFINVAKLCFACNEFPVVTDDPAFFTRLIALPFKRQFFPGAPGTVPRHQMEERLTTPDELSGILNYAILGYLDLQQAERFDFSDDPKEIRDMCLSYVIEPVARFVTEKLEFDQSARTEKAFLYHQFELFCDANGMADKTLEFDEFFKRLWKFYEQKDIEVRCNVDGDRVRLLRIRVKDPAV